MKTDLETIRDIFYRSNDYLAEDGSGFEVGHLDNCHWAISGLDTPHANRLAVYNADPEVFERSLKPFYERNLPHYVKLGGPGLVHVDALIARGYESDGASPTMIYQTDRTRDKHQLRAGLRVKLVETIEELWLCQEILADGFNRPRSPSRDYDDPFPEAPSTFRYLLFADDVPVSTAQFVRTGTYVACFATSTLSTHQRNGYGEELIRHAISDQASRGTETVILQSSHQGVPLYTKIGFEVLEYFQNWQMNSVERMRRFTHHEINLGEYKLRPIVDSDADVVIPSLNDAAMVKWMQMPSPFTEVEFHAAQKRWKNRELAGWSMEWGIEKDGVLQGRIAVHHTDWIEKRTEIGYLTFPQSRGKGVMPTVLRSLVEFLFEEYKFERIEVRTDTRNVASRRVAEKAGFTLEGILRRNYINAGEITDDAIYAMIRSDLAG